MHNYPLIVLEYHQCNERTNKFVYSRTYDQHREDLKTVFDWIVMDDGRHSQIKACDILRENNIRAKLAIVTGKIGKKGGDQSLHIRRYLDEKDIRKLSLYHDIENHTHTHRDLTEMDEIEVRREVQKANENIIKITGRRPRYLIPPFNKINDTVRLVALKEKLILIENRKTIKNITKLK
jgi:peptidoglycan/xylan/chitin deacetylase (PgdA/CDA1 family)